MAQTAYIPAGIKLLGVGGYDSDGIFAGGSATAPVAGDATGSSLRRLAGAQTVPIAAADSEVLTPQGDDIPLPPFDFGPSTLPTGELQIAVEDLASMAYLQNTKVQTVGFMGVAGIQPEAPVLENVFVIAQGRANSYDLANSSQGSAQNVAYLSLRTTLRPRGRDAFTSRSLSVINYTMTTVGYGQHSPWGVTFTQANNGFDATAIMVIPSDYDIWFHRWTGNNVVGAFNLDPLYLPVSQATTLIWVERIQLTAGTDYTVNTTTGAVTFTTPPANNARIVCAYAFVN